MTKTAEQVLQEHYGKHGQCTIQQAKFVRWEDAINAMEAYAAQKPTVAEAENLSQCSKPLTQCMMGRDAECNHPQCPVTDEDEKNGRYCPLPLYDYRQ